MSEDDVLSLMILEDVKEWVQQKILVDETWDEHFDSLSEEDYSKRLDEVMDIYWKDHIFPIDKYVQRL
jgi:hypothetical protein